MNAIKAVIVYERMKKQTTQKNKKNNELFLKHNAAATRKEKY